MIRRPPRDTRISEPTSDELTVDAIVRRVRVLEGEVEDLFDEREEKNRARSNFNAAVRVAAKAAAVVFVAVLLVLVMATVWRAFDLVTAAVPRPPASCEVER